LWGNNWPCPNEPENQSGKPLGNKPVGYYDSSAILSMSGQADFHQRLLSAWLWPKLMTNMQDA
jgi:hypothetical protein